MPMTRIFLFDRPPGILRNDNQPTEGIERREACAPSGSTSSSCRPASRSVWVVSSAGGRKRHSRRIFKVAPTIVDAMLAQIVKCSFDVAQQGGHVQSEQTR